MAAVIGGAVLAAETSSAARDAWAAALAAGSIAVAAAPGAARRTWVALAVLAASCAHAAAARDRVLHAPLDRLITAWEDGIDRATVPAVVRGVLLEDAQITESGVRLVLDVDRVRDAGAWRDTQGRVQALVVGSLAAGEASRWSAGRRVDAPMLLRPLAVWRNPGAPSARRQALGRRLTSAGTIKSAALVEVTPGGWLDETAAAARAYVRRQTARWIAPIDPVSAGIVTAILIGDRAGLPDETARRLQAAGTYHVIAISGGNVAVVALLCLGFVRIVVRWFRPRLAATFVLVLTYGWIVGGDPSVARAVTAACVYLVCRAAGWSVAALDVLGLVAAIVLAADPLLVVDAGAWLSFGAAFAIVVGAGRLAAAIGDARRFRSPVLRMAFTGVVATCSATAAAELMLLPINASLFSRVGIAGLPLNLVAIPAMAVVQIAGLALVVCGGWWATAATAAGWVAHGASSVLVGSSRLVDLVPWITWRVPPPSMMLVGAFYLAGAIAWLAPWIGSNGRRAAAAAVAILSLVIVTSPAVERAAPRAGWLRVTMLDVGQGESILVQSPSGRSLLVDAGGVPGGFDVGERVVVPAAWALGVRRLDWLIFTHPDLDHAGGLLGAAGILRPREIWEGTPVARDERRQALRDWATASGVPWRQVQRGDVVYLDGVELTVHHPQPPDWERQRARNDDSIVLGIRYGVLDLLLTGDIGRAVEAELPDAARRPGLRVLKVAHHGSRTSTSAGFVDRAPPRVALISAGRGNLFGHPAPDVLARLEAAGATVFRTDRDGAIRLDTDGQVVLIETMTGRRRGFSLWPSSAAAGGG